MYKRQFYQNDPTKFSNSTIDTDVILNHYLVQSYGILLFLARLNSCMEGIRNVLGESCPDHIVAQSVIKNNYNMEAALHDLLIQQGTITRGLSGPYVGLTHQVNFVLGW